MAEPTPLTQKAHRAAAAKAFRAAKVPLRKGHWKIQGQYVVWWIDLRADAPSPTAPLTFELGAWVPGAGPEPDGGAIDCPLLADQPAGDDAGVTASALIEELRQIDSLEALSLSVRSQSHLDASLRHMLGR